MTLQPPNKLDETIFIFVCSRETLSTFLKADVPEKAAAVCQSWEHGVKTKRTHRCIEKQEKNCERWREEKVPHKTSYQSLTNMLIQLNLDVTV